MPAPSIDHAPAGFAARLAALGGELGIDAWERVTERAAQRGWFFGGRPDDPQLSAGGACRLIRCADRTSDTEADADAFDDGFNASTWIAVSLPRQSDVDLLPAWLELDGDVEGKVDGDLDDLWAAVVRATATRSGPELVGRGREFGMAMAVVGDQRGQHPPVIATERPLSGRLRDTRPGTLRIVDLSAMWAGPLCAALLGETPATDTEVVKVESAHRPDAARTGDPWLYQRLNGAKTVETIDIRSRAGLGLMQALIDQADVVIEASRPRALDQLGIHRDRFRGIAWVSITGYGRDRSWVGFGDDCAAAGGLVHWPQGPSAPPAFFGDAIADPLTGMVAAAAARRALRDGQPVLLDVAMSAVAASMIAPAPPKGGDGRSERDCLGEPWVQ